MTEPTPTDVDPFAGFAPLPGLEHLGRHITDPQGMPSGSPANFENLRGKGTPALNRAAYADVVSALATEFGDEAPPAPAPEAQPGEE